MSHVHNAVTAQQAWSRLAQGNQRFCAGQPNGGDISAARRADTAGNGQHPYAAVITCSDSRTPAEHIFSAGIGDLFVIRNAGNVVGPFDLGSIEYAVEHLGVPLVLVLGHNKCGAVGAAFEADAGGCISSIQSEIKAAIGDCADVAQAERLNARHSVERIRESQLLRQLEAGGRLEIKAAMYDIVSGQVSLL